MMFGGIFDGFASKKKKAIPSAKTQRVKHEQEQAIASLPHWGTTSLDKGSNSPKIKELLSVPSGVFKDSFTDVHRTCMAVVVDSIYCKKPGDVVLLISPGLHSANVMYFAIEVIKQKGLELVRSFQTEASFIGSQYENMLSKAHDDEFELDEDDEWIKGALNDIMAHAVEKGASDIHLSLRGQLNIKYRINGFMVQPNNNMPHNKGIKLMTSLFSMYVGTITKSDFNASDTVSEAFNYQVTLKKNGKDVTRVMRIRYEQAPGAEIESGKDSFDIVMRVISDGSQLNILSFQDLGFDYQSTELLNNLSLRKRGIVLVVGETGSGKSSTLRTFFTTANQNCGNTKKSLIIEDPPEGHIPNSNTQPLRVDSDEKGSIEDLKKSVVKKIGSAMRQDPDILGIGEIRYMEVADMAMEATLTGHLVGATLHAFSWMGAYSRLVETMNVNPSLLTSDGMVQAIIAQKLTPKLCKHCALKYEDIKSTNGYVDTKAIDVFIGKYCKQIDVELSNETIEYYRSIGIPEAIWERDFSKLRFLNNRPTNDCDKCEPKGVSGRVLLYEIFVPSRHKRSMEHIRSGEFDKAQQAWLKSDLKKGSLIDGYTLEQRAVERALKGEICTHEAVAFSSEL